jgi:23S rRNA (guanosine2251-2'-O)-methyltransferase
MSQIKTILSGPLVSQLQQLFQLGKRIQKQSPPGLVDVETFCQLYRQTLVPELQKQTHQLSHLKHHFDERLFHALMALVERVLDLGVDESEFLVTKIDLGTAVRKFPLHFILHNLRSAFNIGSIMRMADALGVESLIFSGYTPDPNHQKVKKTSLGSELTTPWQQVADLNFFLDQIKNQGHQIIALETAGKSLSLPEFQPLSQTHYYCFLGNERFGLEGSILRQCHHLISIPMYGKKNSLNVAQAAAVFAYDFSSKSQRIL